MDYGSSQRGHLYLYSLSLQTPQRVGSVLLFVEAGEVMGGPVWTCEDPDCAEMVVGEWVIELV